MHLTPNQPIICIIGSKCESRSHFRCSFVFAFYFSASFYDLHTLGSISIVPVLSSAFEQTLNSAACVAMMTCFGYYSKRNEMQIVWLPLFCFVFVFFFREERYRHTAAIILMSEKNLKKTATAFFSILLSQSSALCTEFPHQIEIVVLHLHFFSYSFPLLAASLPLAPHFC